MKIYENNKHDDFIKSKLIKSIKVSGELCKLLETEFNVKSDYARKIIERTTKKGLIKSSNPLSFGKGQFAYYLPNEILDKNKIKEICKSFRPALYRLFESLDTNNGIISYYEALKIVASPLEKSNTKVDYLDDLIKTLKELNFIFTETDKNSVQYIIYKSTHDNLKLMDLHFSKMKLDTVFITDILDWFAKSNIIEKGINCRNKNQPSIGANHNNLLWDAFSYSKTTGINPGSAKDSKTIEKQTLVVFDIVISREYNQYDLDGFLSRIQINLNSVKKGTRKVLPIIVYQNCSEIVLNKSKSLGFLSYNISSIFGSNIFSILENISKVQINQKLLENDDFENVIESTFKTIKNSGQETQLGALKGTLLEVMMYQILKHQYPNAEMKSNIYFSKTIKNKIDEIGTKKGYEYDYIIKSSNPKEIIVVELKAYHSQHEIPLGDYQTKQTIKWFFNNTLQFIKEKFKTEISEGYKYKGCYITTSKIEAEAIEHLKTINTGPLKPKKLDVFYDREKLLNLFIENDFNTLKKIVDKYYL